jgi:PAS domain S-box-containing protein
LLKYALGFENREPSVLIDRMTQFFDATSDAVVFLDRDYKITFLNRRALELISPDGKARGANLFEYFPGTVYPNSPYVENYRRSMEQGEVGEFEAFYPEPLNLWLRVQSYPSSDGIIIFFRDVTQERADRETLRLKNEESERQLSEIETLYRTAPIGLALFDTKDFRYLRLNDRQAQFFGLRPDQVVGRTLTEMAPIEGLRELFERVAGGEPVINFPLEGELATNPGEHRYWTVSYFPVYAQDGSIQAITAASLEITQQKKAEQALVNAEKLVAVGRLASSIAHEINNPLESVTNLLFLARKSNSLEQIHEYLDTAEIELRRVSAISNQTLRFHKQSSSPQDLRCEPLIDGILSIYQGRIVNAHVIVERRLRTHRPVRCFEGEIRQVVSTLVSNAIDALPRSGGRLLLRCREATDWQTGAPGIVITIADSGTGIPPEVEAKLFEPFFTTKGIGGTGLGLWVSKEIIDRHHGHLRVRSSQSPAHRGTVFTLFLPLVAVDR